MEGRGGKGKGGKEKGRSWEEEGPTSKGRGGGKGRGGKEPPGKILATGLVIVFLQMCRFIRNYMQRHCECRMCRPNVLQTM